MRFPHLPAGTAGATRNFEVLETYLTEREQSVAMAWRSAAGKLPSGAWTKITLDKVVQDPSGRFDLGKGCYIVPSDGYYHVDGQVAFELLKGGFQGAAVYVSGTAALKGSANAGQGVEGAQMFQVAGIVRCSPNAEIELRGFQESGVEKSLLIEESANRLSVVRVG